MSKIRFGPTGIGGVDNAVFNLEKYHNLGFGAAEVLFTYGCKKPRFLTNFLLRGIKVSYQFPVGVRDE